jgi:hypothetical protein
MQESSILKKHLEDVNPLKPLSNANLRKSVNLFSAILITVMISACTEQRKDEVQSPPATSQPVISQVSADQSEQPKTGETTPMRSSPPKEWEEVSRLQRVLGTIADIQISDGTIQSIDLKVKQNVQPVNNPVDYDYIGQTLHLIVDEPLSAAGSLQDKLKKGSSFLVNFAQFAIPPKGEVVLGSRFSYNYIFYEHNGSYMDTKGQPFDLKAEFAALRPTTVPTPKTDRKVLYALDANQLTKPLTEIPYYRQGKSEPLPDTVFKQFSEGHQPWLSDPVTVALVSCSNLISSEAVATLQNKATIGGKKIVIDADRIITEVHTEDKDIKVVMSKPGGITYDITMYTPQGTGVLFVKQIIENTPSK